MKIYRELFLGIALFCSTNLLAGPIHFEPQKLKQPNGTILNCFASGDEYYNWLHDSLGYTIIQDQSNGFYVYAMLQDGDLLPSKFVPGIDDPEKSGLKPWLKRPFEKVKEDFANRYKRYTNDDLEKNAPTTGTINNLVVFIRFSDNLEFTDEFSLYDGIFNNTNGVSLRNYFSEVSYGALQVISTFYPVPTSSTILSYQDSYPRAYYEPYSVTNPDGYTSEQEGVREGVLLENALSFIKNQVPPNLDLDGDDDGLVDNICFIIYGSATGWSDLLWPHKSSLSSSRVVMINDARCDEYNLTTQSTAKGGPSSLAHEMFHTLGAPDLYHYTDDGNTPVGRWDLMADNKKPPQHMTAYMKYRYGKWISEIPEITQSGTYTLNPLVNSTNNCYKLKSPNSTTEYFVFEYRQKTGLFEVSLSEEGLLIYRINTSVSGGNRNGPPDAVYVYRPNGTYLVSQSTADAPFCADIGRSTFNNTTNPSCFLSDGSNGNINISNISSLGTTMSFTVTIDDYFVDLKTPVALEQVVAESVKNIEWISVGDVNPMRIDYSIDNGVTWDLISETDVSPYSWTVPNTPTRNAKLRIQSTKQLAIKDSVSFAIAPSFFAIKHLFDATAVTGGSTNSGIVMLGDEFWTSRYSSNLLHRWSYTGTLLQEFSISGINSVRSMTYDGTAVYAVTGSTSIYKIDPTTRTLLATLTSPLVVRNIAYDQHANNDLGGFWVSDITGDWVLISREGVELSRIDAATHGLKYTYGLAMDNVSEYQPCLWAYERNIDIGAPQYIVQIKLPEGTPTGLFHDVMQDAGLGALSPTASGLTFGVNAAGKMFIGGVNQGTPDRVFFYDLTSTADEPICLAALNVPYTENFDGLGMGSEFSLINNISILGFYAYRTLSNVVPNIFKRSAGATATGGFYNYGNSPDNPDRAIGGIQSSITSTLYYGIRFKNQTGTEINSLDVTYSGEQWRTGGSSTTTITNMLAFEYQQALKIHDLTSGEYTPFNDLSFTSPTLTPYQTALDGNISTNRTILHAIIPVTIPNGEEIMLRWRDVEDASYDHSFAIDDFTVIPKFISTGVESGSIENSSIQIFPNPASDVLNINCNYQKSMVVKIFDIAGNQILTQSVEFGIQQIDIKNLSSGFYLVRVIGAIESFAGKFIKN